MLGSLPLSHIASPEPKQDVPRGPSPDAIAAARDLVFGGLADLIDEGSFLRLASVAGSIWRRIRVAYTIGIASCPNDRSP